MEAISETQWDLVIDGTGLPESLLALALSRSGKKILHVDRNASYGGPEAALSLQDAEQWAATNDDDTSRFKHVCITKEDTRESGPQLGFSRAYSLALAPQIVHSRSVLLPTLVSSKTYRQLEFLAVGSWFVCEPAGGESWRTIKIPAGREDVFADKSIDLKAKRSVIKLLRLVTDPEAQAEALGQIGDATLAVYLNEHYSLPKSLQTALCALTLSPVGPDATPASWALPRLSRHLASIGVFGPGFAAVIPKWGGLSEVAQVACRALAVGGGTYMLGHGIEQVEDLNDTEARLSIKLRSGDTVQTVRLAELAPIVAETQSQPFANGRLAGTVRYARSITIIASTLDPLFPPLGEGAPPPAAAIAVLAAGVGTGNFPVYLTIHSSDTGECPKGQCVVYANTVSEGNSCHHLRTAVECLLRAAGDEPAPCVLWTLEWLQDGPSVFEPEGEGAAEGPRTRLEPLSMDLAFDDRVLRDVRRAWLALGGEEGNFMEFEDREVGAYDDNDE